MRTHSLPAIALLVLLLLHTCSGVLADRTNLSMVRVVSPERVVYTISDEDAIRPLVDRLYIDNDREWRNHLVGNLKQLCGFAHVYDNGRNQAANWVRLEDVVWVRLHYAGEYVPLVGSVKHMYDSVMEPRADYQNTKAALGELLPGTSGKQKKTHISWALGKRGGPFWRVVRPPSSVLQLVDGSNLTDVNSLLSLIGEQQVRADSPPMQIACNSGHRFVFA